MSKRRLDERGYMRIAVRSNTARDAMSHCVPRGRVLAPYRNGTGPTERGTPSKHLAIACASASPMIRWRQSLRQPAMGLGQRNAPNMFAMAWTARSGTSTKIKTKRRGARRSASCTSSPDKSATEQRKRHVQMRPTSSALLMTRGVRQLSQAFADTKSTADMSRTPSTQGEPCSRT